MSLPINIKSIYVKFFTKDNIKLIFRQPPAELGTKIIWVDYSVRKKYGGYTNPIHLGFLVPDGYR